MKVIVTYFGGKNSAVDNVLERVVGRPLDGAGCLLIDPTEPRDVEWNCRNRAEVEMIRLNLQAFKEMIEKMTIETKE